jgi:hypothetical protein
MCNDELVGDSDIGLVDRGLGLDVVKDFATD